MRKSYAFIIDIILLLIVAITGLLLWHNSQFSAKNYNKSNRAIDSDHYAVTENTSFIPSNSNINPKKFDAFGKGIHALQFSETGERRYQLYSPELLHYKTDNLTLIKQPKLALYNKGNYPWVITAEHAEAYEGLKKISFIGDVAVSGDQTKDYQGSLLTSNKLYYYPDENKASTDQAVTIKQPGTELHANGMEIFFDPGKIQLLSNVDGRYDPTKQAKQNTKSQSDNA